MTLKDKHIILEYVDSRTQLLETASGIGEKRSRGTSGYHAGGKRVYHSAYVIDVE